MERDRIFTYFTDIDFISTHTLTWSVTSPQNPILLEVFHFNSHAHVERDFQNAASVFEEAISTHTLTWSVTTGIYDGNIIACISTHTLTWSVTAQALIDEGNFEDFNSHAHVERDNRTDYILSHAKISTHTLTWSVTPRLSPFSASASFQLTRSRGA